MVEASRRHGHHDPRFGPSRRKSHLHLVHAPDDGVDDEGLDAWEDEGGRSAASRATMPPAALDWEAFSWEFFPGRRRHDFEVVKAFEAYRATGALPAEPDSGPRLEAVAVAVSLPR